MLQAILNALFGRETIEDAMYTFNKAIRTLERVEQQETRRRERVAERIAHQREQLEDANRKACAARRQCDKLARIFGDDDEKTASAA